MVAVSLVLGIGMAGHPDPLTSLSLVIWILVRFKTQALGLLQLAWGAVMSKTKEVIFMDGTLVFVGVRLVAFTAVTKTDGNDKSDCRFSRSSAPSDAGALSADLGVAQTARG